MRYVIIFSKTTVNKRGYVIIFSTDTDFVSINSSSSRSCCGGAGCACYTQNTTTGVIFFVGGD